MPTRDERKKATLQFMFGKAFVAKGLRRARDTKHASAILVVVIVAVAVVCLRICCEFLAP